MTTELKQGAKYLMNIHITPEWITYVPNDHPFLNSIVVTYNGKDERLLNDVFTRTNFIPLCRYNKNEDIHAFQYLLSCCKLNIETPHTIEMHICPTKYTAAPLQPVSKL